MKQENKFSEKRLVAIMSYMYKELKTKSIPYRKLMKLLYLCDRNMYNSYGVSITNDNYVSMHNGPVLSTADSLIQLSANKDIEFYFKKYFVKEGKDVVLQKSVENFDDDSELSEEEKYIMESVMCIFGEDDEDRLIEFTHTTCSEWKDPQEQGMAIYPITEQDIRRALGKDE